MKTKTFSILFALVMILSLSVGAFAQDYTETWDENTILQVFSDLDLVFPDLFADIDSDFLWTEGTPSFPSAFPTADDGSYNAKAPIANATPYNGIFTYDPCGDGLIKYEFVLDRDPFVVGTDETPWTAVAKYGPERTSYIRNVKAQVGDDTVAPWHEAEVKKCTARGEDNCNIITFNRNGQAKVTGYLYYPEVLTMAESGLVPVNMTVEFSNYFTALWDVPSSIANVTGFAVANAKRDYCQASIDEAQMDGVYTIRAKYDQHTGEARFQAVIRNFAQESNRPGGYKAKTNYVIPADIMIPQWNVKTNPATGEVDQWESIMDRYTDYTCKYTIYNNANGHPYTDYCKFGEGIALAPNAVIRFDITVDHLSSKVLLAYDEGNIPFRFRVGGMTYLVGEASTNPLYYADGGFSFDGVNFYPAYAPVYFPCPYVSRMQVKDPLKPFTSFFNMDSDPAIKPSGAYGTYEGGVWGLYQKCGKYAWIAVRLYNDGIRDEMVNLNNVAVAINGGTPMSFHWVLSTEDTIKGNKVLLAPRTNLVLIGRAKVTDVPSQLNSDVAMSGAVNFTDFGFYITGKIYSDHNNTNCVAAPK